MQSFFPQQQVLGTNDNSVLLKFNAGKCQLEPQGNKFLVSPDIRKGRIVLSRSSDGLISFRWENRMSNNASEDERIIFPNEAKFKKVKTGRDNDRVYVLQFEEGQRHMFWMQEKDNSKDNEYVTKLNDFLNNPAAVTAALASSSTVGGDVANSSHDTLMRFFGDSSNSATTNTSTAPTVAGGLDFSSLLGSFNTTVPASTTSSSNTLTTAHLQQALSAAMTQSQQARSIPLQDILTTDGILNSGILNDSEVQNELVQHLPEGQQTNDFLEANIRSPQFQQSLDAFTDAINSSPNEVMGNVGVDPIAGQLEMVRLLLSLI